MAVNDRLQARDEPGAVIFQAQFVAINMTQCAGAAEMDWHPAEAALGMHQAEHAGVSHCFQRAEVVRHAEHAGVSHNVQPVQVVHHAEHAGMSHCVQPAKMVCHADPC